MAKRRCAAGDAQIAGIRVNIAADSGKRNLGRDHDALFANRQQLCTVWRTGRCAIRERFMQAALNKCTTLPAASGDGKTHPRGHKQLFAECAQHLDQFIRPCVEILLQFAQPAVIADARAAL